LTVDYVTGEGKEADRHDKMLLPVTRNPRSSHDMPPRSAYVHVPFCRHRCGYCNFTLVAGRDDLIPAFLDALEAELAALGGPHLVDTLFIGGGTPTHLSLSHLERLLRSVAARFPLAAGHEFSVEANPADITAEKVDLLWSFGATRISLGAQSFDAAKLRLLERDHDAAQIERAVELCRSGIDQVSLDLIFAVPHESLDAWRRDLRSAIELAPDHVSTYGLTFEKGTAFWQRRLRDELTAVAEETERAMYAAAIDELTTAGFEHYEVSNFARPGRRCRHNEVYWAGGEYFAVGPGAARHVDGRRETNHRSVQTYLKRMATGQSPVAESERLDPRAKARELLVFALRRNAGIERAEFARRTGFELDELVGGPLGRFVEQGLLEDDGQRIRLTRDGLFVSDALWPDLLVD